MCDTDLDDTQQVIDTTPRAGRLTDGCRRTTSSSDIFVDKNANYLQIENRHVFLRSLLYSHLFTTIYGSTQASKQTNKKTTSKLNLSIALL